VSVDAHNGKFFPVPELEAAGVKRISLATSLYLRGFTDGEIKQSDRGDRHRGSGRPLSPATPPDMRVRIRRFGWIELWTGEQPWDSKRVEVSDWEGVVHGWAVG
jgi:hypothetical protein